jgi:hypothetical protein
MILCRRASQISSATTKPVLMLRYNKVLASRLRQVMDARGLVS